MTNSEFSDSLRQVAAFYEEHPDMPQPWDTLSVYMYEREGFVKAALTLAKGGRIEKKADKAGDICADYHAFRKFGGVTVDVRIPRRAICRLISEAVYDCPDSLLEEAAEYAEVER